MRLLAVSVLASVLSASSSFAAVIFSISGPNDNTLGTTFPIGVGLGAVFTTPVDYQNVKFSTIWTAFGGATNISFEAFLTTQVGPGTNATHEVASVSPVGGVTIATSNPSAPFILTSFELLTVPYLPAGTYYLLLRGADWSGGNPFSVSSPDSTVIKNVASGVTVDSRLFSGGGVTYLPADVFTTSPNLNTWFTAVGDPVTSSAVPEPSTITLCGVVMVILLRRSRS